MRFNVIVISKLNLFRLSLLKKFKTLGFNVSTFSGIREPIQRLNRLNPDVVIFDEDDAGQGWKTCISGLKRARKKIIFILVVKDISINQANEAVALGVSGIILKPFDPEKDLKKILATINKKYSISPKRSSPRFFLDPADQPEISYFSKKDDTLYTLLVVNISENGATIRSLTYESLEELQPGFTVPDASLSLSGITVNLSFKVIYRENDLIGIDFEEINEGQHELFKYIQAMYIKVFGPEEENGEW